MVTSLNALRTYLHNAHPACRVTRHPNMCSLMCLPLTESELTQIDMQYTPKKFLDGYLFTLPVHTDSASKVVPISYRALLNFCARNSLKVLSVTRSVCVPPTPSADFVLKSPHHATELTSYHILNIASFPDTYIIPNSLTLYFNPSTLSYYLYCPAAETGRSVMRHIQQTENRLFLNFLPICLDLLATKGEDVLIRGMWEEKLKEVVMKLGGEEAVLGRSEEKCVVYKL